MSSATCWGPSTLRAKRMTCPAPNSRMSRLRWLEGSYPSHPTMKRWPTFRTSSLKGRRSASQAFAHDLADLVPVRRLPRGLERGQRRYHELAHVLGRGRPRLRHRFLHRGRDVGVGGLRGQVGLEDRDFRPLLVRQFLPARLHEVLDGLLALLHEALEHARGLRLLDGRSLVDLLVLERGLRPPHRP